MDLNIQLQYNQLSPIDTNQFVEEMKNQFALDDKRVIGELIGYGLTNMLRSQNTLMVFNPDSIT